MYNQQYAGNVGSQYQGFQKQYQPVGTVPSVYGQNQNQQQFGGYASTENYHTANYRGNQIGHDAGLRGDSFAPAQHQQFGVGAQNTANYGSFGYGVRGNETAFAGANNVSSQFGMGQSQYGNTASRSFGQMGTATGPIGSSYGQMGTSIGQTGTSWSQGSYPSAESFHTANYRGNQMGHDAGLRGDSFAPAQQQQQFGGQNTANYSSFGYGVRGNEAGYSGMNNMGQQFGYNNSY
jgi:hypothetical protein